MFLARWVFAAALAAAAGCTSFHETQSVVFVDEDGRFASVTYGYGDDDHSTTFVSPVNGKTVELKSKLRVRVALPDDRGDAKLNGESFTAFQCMNMLRSGTMYKTDDGEWMFLANGFTCAAFRLEEKGPKKGDYLMVFQGELCQPRAGGDEKGGR